MVYCSSLSACVGRLWWDCLHWVISQKWKQTHDIVPLSNPKPEQHSQWHWKILWFVCLLSEVVLCGVLWLRYKRLISNVKPAENRVSLTPDTSWCLTRKQCCAVVSCWNKVRTCQLDCYLWSNWFNIIKVKEWRQENLTRRKKTRTLMRYQGNVNVYLIRFIYFW